MDEVTVRQRLREAAALLDAADANSTTGHSWENKLVMGNTGDEVIEKVIKLITALTDHNSENFP